MIPLLGIDLQFTLVDNGLLSVREGMAGLTASSPFLDEDIVALSLELPVDWKVRRDALRPSCKRALAEFLPREPVA